MGRGLVRLFLKDKPVSALLAVEELHPAYAALVAKRIDSTYPHASTVLSELERAGLLAARPKGRIRYLELTDRGRSVASALRALLEAIEEPDPAWMRMGRIREAVESAKGVAGAEQRVGPFRRDLAILAKEGGDLAKEARDLDRQIGAILGEG
ncbi:MAG: winged helix-turn-helix transcriptional regulator [Methanotrichaceae archaeon]|nr:winged helix-turn-helix transcriptional regulator [Methanotrichaceae archaeon]